MGKTYRADKPQRKRSEEGQQGGRPDREYDRDRARQQVRNAERAYRNKGVVEEEDLE